MPSVLRFFEHFPVQEAHVAQWSKFVRHKGETLEASRGRADREALATLKAFDRDSPPRHLATFPFRQARIRANPSFTEPPELIAQIGFLLAGGHEGGELAQTSDLSDARAGELRQQIIDAAIGTAAWPRSQTRERCLS